jgi:endonuclease/exonuclease/phosphatase (EEP) superfamily protein YafD
VLLLGVLTSLAILCLKTPDVLPVKLGASYAPQLMLGYFVLGIAFLCFKQPRLTFTSFACAAALCLFLKENSHDHLKYAVETTQPKVKIAHFNTINFEPDYEATLKTLQSVDADLVSIQNLNFDWFVFLENEMSDLYPFKMTLPSLGNEGIAVYSKFPFSSIDTLKCGNMPNIIGSVTVNGAKDFYFISSLTSPSNTTEETKAVKRHLESIRKVCLSTNSPLIIFGEYHLAPWSSEVQAFKNTCQLNDSRTGFSTTYPHGYLNLLEVPTDHIFYSDDFKCTGFNTVSGETSKHVGIVGSFQYMTADERSKDVSYLYFSDAERKAIEF